MRLANQLAAVEYKVSRLVCHSISLIYAASLLFIFAFPVSCVRVLHCWRYLPVLVVSGFKL